MAMRTKNMVYIALFAVLICVCAQIAIPSAVPFTMQSFAVFVSLFMLGGKKSALTVSLYILLGAVGLPVFSSFQGGAGVLFGASGGFIIGFLVMALVYWLAASILPEKRAAKIIAAILALTACYTVGVLQYMFVAMPESGVSAIDAIKVCVLPFLAFDMLKLALAFLVGEKLKKHMKF